ncbi:MAG: mannitol dehydrogenase family protein [Rhodospirillales bacterium]|nr:mannitol dehydrogenase family protein [Alphaproteobacteria bacterium]MCB9986297.1 mannitol dehydrogenase family protein [Rhodospirillales bacterium]USO07150.1 MAG: mannitol dehydrogenase family protein [Rhodospirillales bacterium]
MTASPAAKTKVVPLKQGNLASMPEGVEIPGYDRGKLVCGIVHLGFGGFHRAHMARYTHELMQKDFSANAAWAIAGAGLMPGDKKMQDALAPQDVLYTLVEREGTHEKASVIGSAAQIIFAGESSAELLAQIEKPSTKIVSLTVTENGYCLNPVTKKLDPNHPVVAADLTNPQTPKSAIGIIVESYNRRMQKGMKPFTALSCDNIQHNGNVLCEAVMAFAKLRDPKLAAWIEQNATFPNTMVDRITPVTKSEDIAYVEQSLGIADAWPVVCESFTQWVIEDKFVDGRPSWENVGAQFVPDVEPYEVMKLRLLNASHLAVACLGDLAGYTYIDETMANPLFKMYMRALMDRETGQTLLPVPGIDLPAYKQKLVDRFANPAIKDTVQRVATDAPLNTVLASIKDRLKKEESIDLLALALAAWLRRVRGGKDETGREIVVRHPLAVELQEKAVEGGANPAPLLAMTQLFGDLGKDPRVVEPVSKYLASIYSKGTLETMREASVALGF